MFGRFEKYLTKSNAFVIFLQKSSPLWGFNQFWEVLNVFSSHSQVLHNPLYTEFLDFIKNFTNDLIFTAIYVHFDYPKFLSF